MDQSGFPFVCRNLLAHSYTNPSAGSDWKDVFTFMMDFVSMELKETVPGRVY